MDPRIPGEYKTGEAVEEPFVPQINFEEAVEWLAEHVEEDSRPVDADFFIFEPVFGLQRGVPITAQQIAGEARVGNVEEVIFEPFGRAIHRHKLMDRRLREAGFAFLEQANDRVGIHAPFVHPAAEKIVATLEVIGVRCERTISRDDSPDFFGEHGGDPLVGVELEDPGTRAGIYGDLLVYMKVGPIRLVEHFRAVLRGDRDGRIGTPAVDDDDLSRETFDRIQASSQIFGFVIHCEGD